MSFCKHTGWLRVWKRGDQVTLEASDRTGRLLHHVRQEEPIGVVVFIGHQRKYGVLSSLQLRSRSARARKSHGEIHLDVAHIPRNQQMLIVDGDLPRHGQLPRTQGAFSCHEVTSKQYTAAPPLAASVSDSIYHRALFPSTDVVCLFAEDIGGLDCALQHLSAWNCQGPSSTAIISPAILLVVDRGQEAKAKAKLRAENLQRPHGWFHMIRVVSIDREAHRSSNRRQAKSYQSLFMEISRLIRSAQTQRRRESLLFSARHVLDFLRIAAARAVEERWTPLDFVKASRLFHQVEENIESHLLNLISQFEHQDDVTDVAAPLVASSFLLNHYVPDMHDFDPTAVFGSLYQKSCENVARVIAAHRDEVGVPPMATGLPSLILHNFCVLYKKRRQHNGSIDVHRKQLAHTHQRCRLPSSEETCFGCLQRRPQHCLPCGHWLCQICVRIFYDEFSDEPWLYNVDTCVICGLATDQHRIRIKPDTADPCVLSIDGGGARGRGPLEFLRILEETIGLPFPVQKHFDVVFATSSGAMTACALCLNGWPVDYCIDFFELSSRLAFDSNRLSRIVAFLVGDVPIVSPLLQALSSLLADSKYSAKKLESIQKDAYGESRSIVDSKAASEMGISLGVTLTTTGDASTYIATNYNGVGCRDGMTDYANLTFGGGTRNVPLWEILRCCTAAPYYFTPYHIAGTGTFQDGGLAFNNPAAIALRESEALFPAAAAPRVVVSLGTGSADPKRSGDRASLWDGLFPARLFRAFWKQSDSAAAWDQLIGHQTSDRGADFFRFDIAFGEQAPSLDDVRGMDEVARLARESVLASTEMRRLSSCLRAGLFFFELDGNSLPIMRRGTYYCTGKLKCRLRAGSDELRALLGQLHQSSAVFQCQGQELLAVSSGRGGSIDATHFEKEIALQVPSSAHALAITLKEEAMPCHVSGSPFTLGRLQRQQHLHAPFGTAYHRQRHVQ